jgi:hypothetical protein
MHDEPQEPMDAEQGGLMTLAEASPKLGRHLRLLQRWVKQGWLPTRGRERRWPYATLVSWDDLQAVAGRRRRGRSKPKPATFTTAAGHTMVIHATPIKKEESPGEH